MILLMGLAGWIICGVIASGITYAYFQGKYPSLSEDFREDAGFSVAIALFGPLGLVAVYLLTGFAKYGWTLPGKKPK